MTDANHPVHRTPGACPAPTSWSRRCGPRPTGCRSTRTRSPGAIDDGRAGGGRAAARRWHHVVNDGEMSKPSYATYVKDRLNGFDGESVQSYHFADLVDFPAAPRWWRATPAVASAPRRRAPGRSPWPIRSRRSTTWTAWSRAAGRPPDLLQCRVAGGGRRCSSATSTTRTTRSTCSPSPRRCGGVRGDRRRRHDRPAGLSRPRDGPALRVRRDGRRRVPAHDRHQHRGAQPRGAQHPHRAAADAPLLGQLPRSAPRTCSIADIADLVWKAEARDGPVRRRQPAPRARVGGPGRDRRARRQGHLPRRHRAAVELHRAPRSSSRSASSGGRPSSIPNG